MLLANPIIRPASNKASSIGRNQGRLGDAIIFSLSTKYPLHSSSALHKNWHFHAPNCPSAELYPNQ
ncbi:uncharacterized protein QC763_0033500 [Podospora pseudopauciseta]|uniref:Uncharacterized protein n=1 Tax=Podospora pseudopauciseta TaxID=2093780 RepID=A0ABR0HP16_9PEZI|nr:hypothetical protein QC763_0033500 [Podospora pseudopauciseta]